MRWETIVRVKGGLAERIVSLGGEWDDSLYVIGSPDGSSKNPETLGKEWSMLVKLEGWKGTQGLPVRFHDLRHAFATLAIAGGMDVMVLAKVLGHRDAAATLNVYATALADAKRSEMERMDSIVFQSPEKAPRGKHFRMPA